MYRNITSELKRWKERPGRKPLLLTGVRQCGKTYTVKEFAEKEFDSYVFVNFEESARLSDIFEYDFNVKRIMREIEMYYQVKIEPGRTLVFFDEIQACPKAVTALKYFCEDMRELHLICAGSLLGVALTHKHISFPVGKVNRLKLYPMNFMEFVIANGRKDLVDIFMDWPDNRPVPEIYSIPMNKLLKEFYVVGGMPEVVKTWIETHDYGEVDRLQRDILRDYSDDFSKYAPDGEVPKLRWIWDSVPVQIAKENNKFIFSHVKAGKRSADLEDALQWLTDAGLLIKCTLVEKPQIPLSGFADETYFKVYMSDIGLLRARSGLSPEAIIDEHGSYDRFKGAFAENYVLTELLSLGKEAHFWRSGNSAEVDFLFESNSSFIPVEVKSADNTQAKSYKQFCKLYKPSKGFKLSNKNVAKNLLEETVTYSLPLYMTWNINRYL